MRPEMLVWNAPVVMVFMHHVTLIVPAMLAAMVAVVPVFMVTAVLRHSRHSRKYSSCHKGR
jgi:hypothetical protein